MEDSSSSDEIQANSLSKMNAELISELIKNFAAEYFLDRNIARKNEVALKIQEFLESKGVERNLPQIKQRFQDFIKTYKKSLEKLKEGQPVNWPYFEVMHEALNSDEGPNLPMKIISDVITDMIKNFATEYFLDNNVKRRKEVARQVQDFLESKGMKRNLPQIIQKFRSLKSIYKKSLQKLEEGQTVDWIHFDVMNEALNSSSIESDCPIKMTPQLTSEMIKNFASEYFIDKDVERRKEVVRKVQEFLESKGTNLNSDQIKIKFYMLKHFYKKLLKKLKKGQPANWIHFDVMNEALNSDEGPNLPMQTNSEVTSEMIKNFATEYFIDKDLRRRHEVARQVQEFLESKGMKRNLPQIKLKFKDLKHLYIKSLKKLEEGQAVDWIYFEVMNEALNASSIESDYTVQMTPQLTSEMIKKFASEYFIDKDFRRRKEVARKVQEFLESKGVNLNSDQIKMKFYILKHFHKKSLKKLKEGQRANWIHFDVMNEALNSSNIESSLSEPFEKSGFVTVIEHESKRDESFEGSFFDHDVPRAEAELSDFEETLSSGEDWNPSASSSSEDLDSSVDSSIAVQSQTSTKTNVSKNPKEKSSTPVKSSVQKSFLDPSMSTKPDQNDILILINEISKVEGKVREISIQQISLQKECFALEDRIREMNCNLNMLMYRSLNLNEAKKTA